jgi:Na+/H+ antiporter NhaC
MLYLTITFLVVLLEDLDKNLTEVFLVSFYLYLIFILISKTEYGFFIAIIILTAVIYILYLKRNEIAKRTEDTTSNEELEKLEKTKNLIIKINNGISIVVFILIFIGFMIYMGRKKYEYKNNFSYLTFIFGKVECKGTISNIDYSTSLKHVFK